MEQKHSAIPYPGGADRKERSRPILGVWPKDPAFAGVAAAFCEIVKKEIGITLSEKDGLCLRRNPVLPPEAYRVTINEAGGVVEASDVAGIAHALATLFQTAAFGPDGMTLPCGVTEDAPDSEWRGFMIDLARQWHEPSYLFRYVDLCWRLKLNRLQLHFTDKQSFTLPMKAYPKLSTEGRTYTRETISELRQYAADRGVTLVPEVDVPGHADPFNWAYPEIFGNETGLIRADEGAFAALRTIFSEVIELFPDSPYLHIGGDEAEIRLWENDDQSMAWRERNGFSDTKEMYSEFVGRVTDTVFELGRTPVVWEGFPKEGNGRIDKRTLVFSWENYYQSAPELVAGGFRIINASWKPLYLVSPEVFWSPEEIGAWNKYTFAHWWDKSAAFHGIRLEKDAPVIGGQYCAWGDRLAEMTGDDIPRGVKTEFEMVSERLPSFAKKVWKDVSPQ